MSSFFDDGGFVQTNDSSQPPYDVLELDISNQSKLGKEMRM
jgi:hypothetical protein